MTTQYLTPANEQEWLAWRMLDITSTEAPALFGLSPYATPFELWHRKKSGDADGFEDNERMQAGRHIEPAIASLVAERYGVVVEPFKVYARDMDARLGSSFDFIIRGAVGQSILTEIFVRLGDGILECKNVDFLIHRSRWTEDECPDHIEIQLQHQLELTGLAWGAIAALVGGNTLWLYVRERDAGVGRAIRVKAAEFWQSIASNQPPPPVMPDDADALIAMYQFAQPGKILDARADAWWNETAAEFARLAGIERQAEEDRKVLKARILEAAGDHSKVVLESGSFSLSQTADSPGKVITPEMVGETIGARAGFRSLRHYPKKEKTA